MLEKQDTIIITSYLLLVCAMGIYFYWTRPLSAKSFLDGDKNFPTTPIFFSMVGTWISNVAIVGLAAAAFHGQWLYLTTFLAHPVVAILIAVYFVPRLRKNCPISVYSYLGNRLGPWTGKLASFLYLLPNLVRMTLIMYLLSVLLEKVTGIDENVVLIIVALASIAYTFLGGLRAVIWTDVLQTSVFVAAIVLMLLCIFGTETFSFEAFKNYSLANSKFSLGEFSTVASQGSFWLLFVDGILSSFQCLLCEQNAAQRYLVAKSTRSAQVAIITSAFAVTLLIAMILLIGTSLSYIFQTPEDATRGDLVIVHFISNLPPGTKGFIITGLLAAAMSSIDTELNCFSVVLFTHFLEPIFKRLRFSPQKNLHAVQLIAVACGIIPVIGIFFVPDLTNVADAWNHFDSLFGSILTGLMTLALILTTKKTYPILAGVFATSFVLLWSEFSDKLYFIPNALKIKIEDDMVMFFGLLIMLTTYFLFSKISLLISKR